MGLLAAHLVQQLVDVCLFVDEMDGRQQLRQLDIVVFQVRLQVLAGLQDADDVVDGIAVNGDAGILLPADHVEDLLGGAVDVEGGHIDAGREDVLHGGLAEVEGRLDQLALVGLEAALLLHGIDDVMELFFGDGGHIVGAEELRRQVADALEEEGKRRQQLHQKGHGARKAQRQLLAVVACVAFGQHFDKQKDEHGGPHGHGRHRPRAPKPRGQHGGQRGEGDVGDVGADEHGDQRLVEPVRDADGLFGAGHAVFGVVADAYRVHGGIGRLGGGEIRARQRQHGQQKVDQTTATVHRTKPSPVCSQIPDSRVQYYTN